MSGWKTTGNVNYYDEIVEPEQQGIAEAQQGALEETLQNVKKSLWDIERHTHDTQSRLDKNNKSGPSHYARKISRWAANDWALDMIGETLVEMQHTLETSAIARHSESPLEKSLAVIQKSAVSFNEKTLRWHDEQTNLMVKGSDPRVQAAKLKPSSEEPSGEGRRAVEGEIHWPSTITGFLKEIAENTKEILKKTGQSINMTAEDEMEAAAYQEERAREVKKHGRTMSGIWKSMKENAKGGWLAKNWKMILAALVLLFMPLKWFKPLWEMVKVAWDFTKDHPFIAAMIGLGVVLLGPLKIIAFAIAGLGKIFKMGIGGLGKLFKKTPKVKPDRITQKADRAATKTAKATGKGTTTAVTKTATTAATKTATKGTGKAVSKGLGKSLLKKIPGIGLLFGAGFAVSKAMAGDFTGAGMELASGAMSIVPGIGTAGSVAMDAAIMARDMGAMKGKEKEGKQLGDDLNKAYKEGEKEASDKAVKVTTTHKKGITPMGPMESIKVKATVGELTPRMSKLYATKRLEKMRKRKKASEARGGEGLTGREEKRIRKLLVGEDYIPKKSILDKRKKQKGSKWEGWDASGGHHSAVEMWKQMTDEERKKFARYKPKGADDKAIAVKTPPRSDFKTKIPQVGVPEGKDPFGFQGEPSKWLPFGHDKSAFKKQTSFGDRFKNLAKFLWGDKKADEKKGAEPATGADAKSVEMAVARWVKDRKGWGKKSADRSMKNYIRKLIGFQDEGRLALLEKKLKSLDTEKVGGSSRWFKRSGFEKEKDAWVVTTPGVEGVSNAKMHRKGVGPDSSIARAWSGEEGAMEVAKERFPGIKFTARQNPNDQMETMNGIHNERAALGNQAPPPSIISSEVRTTNVQENPLNYVAQPSARGKDVPQHAGSEF